jgi:hypothetical protein
MFQSRTLDGQHLYIVRANGKEQKAKIFRKKLASQ